MAFVLAGRNAQRFANEIYAFGTPLMRLDQERIGLCQITAVEIQK